MISKRFNVAARSAVRVLVAFAVVLGTVPFIWSTAVTVSAQGGTSVFINEIHYDNAGTDSGEILEIAGPAGMSVSDYQIVLYNGSNGAPYSTVTIGSPTSLPDSCGGLGILPVHYPVNGIQNGAPDGIALVDATGTVIQFLSYEGSFTATSGPASGMTSTDIGVSESGSDPIGLSLQLVGAGQYYEDFTWQGPFPSSVNRCNDLQTYVAGEVAPSVTSTTPADGASNVAVNTNLTVTFNEPVNLGANWFQVVCIKGGMTSSVVLPGSSVVTGGPTTFTINPNTDFLTDESCTLSVYLDQVTDQDTDDPPDYMAADQSFTFVTARDLCTSTTGFTPIYAIQGSGTVSPLVTAGTTEDIFTRGVVTADFQDNDRNGFFIQAPTGDGDSATSDGVFVYENARTESVALGDLVAVIGDVTEYNGLTEISAKHYDGDHVIQVCGSGSVGSTTVNLPIPAGYADAEAFWERYEGMYVTIPQELTVTDIYTLGRYGEAILSTGGRLWQYTQKNAPSASGYQDYQDNLFRRQVMIADHETSQNAEPIIIPAPALSGSNNLRGGETISGLTGVLNFGYGDYFLESPFDDFGFSLAANPRQTTPPDVGGTLTVGSFNLYNFFTTLDSDGPICGPSASLECRGADSLSEYNRQLAKTVAALAGLNADIVGLAEIENHATDDALNTLVSELNAVVGAGTYAAISTGPIGTDAIKVAMIYKPGVVTPVGAYRTLDYTGAAASNYRPSLAQTFEENATGEMFTLVMNHFKSKGSCPSTDPAVDPDQEQGDGQGCWNYTRTMAADQLAKWLATDPTGSGDPDFMVVGDLNVYAQEDPVGMLASNGFTDLIEQYVGYLNSAYSYLYFAQWGTLDYAFANGSLALQVTGASEWHINSDEPPAFDYNSYNQPSLYAPDAFRSADHDPLLIGLALQPPVVVDPADPGYVAPWTMPDSALGDPTSLPATGYAPAEHAQDRAVSPWLIGALAALVISGLVLGGWTLRRKTR